MRRRTYLGGMATAALSAALPAVPDRSARAQTPIVLKLATADTMQDTSYKVGERFGQEIARRTDGRYSVQMYVNGALGSTVNLASSLQTGIIDCAILTSGFLESFAPSVQVIDLPFVFKDAPTAERLLDGELGRRLFAEMETKGIKGLAWGWYGWRQLETRDRAVTTPDDMRGLKIRIQPGPVFAAMFRAVGAVPIALDGSEVYLALSQQTVGGVDFPMPTSVTFKMYEVTKYLALTQHVYNAGALMVSKARWEQLSEADRTAFQEAATGLLPYWRATIGKASEDAETFLRAHGMQVTTVDFKAFHEKMDPVYSQFSPKYPDLFKMIMAEHA